MQLYCIILRALYYVHYTTCIILHVMIVPNKSMHYPACYGCTEQHAEIRLYYSYTNVVQFQNIQCNQ